MKTIKYNNRIETRNYKGDLHSFNDNPAIVWYDGSKFWYKEGELHRLNGPSVEYRDGYKEWYENGKRHRLDGPAIEYVNGTKYWYKEDKLHRSNGPAIEYNDGDKYWHYEGKKIECDSTEEFLKIINMKAFW